MTVETVWDASEVRLAPSGLRSFWALWVVNSMGHPEFHYQSDDDQTREQHAAGVLNLR